MLIEMSCPCGHSQKLPDVHPCIWEEGSLRTRCAGCGEVRHQQGDYFRLLRHSLPVAAGLVECTGLGPRDRVLAVSRKDDSTAFGIPGGKVDPGDGSIEPEDFLASVCIAVSREVHEEAGVYLHPGKFQVVFQGVCSGPWGQGQPYWMVALAHPDAARGVFASQPGEGTVTWVPWSQLEAGPFGEYNRKLRAHLWDESFEGLSQLEPDDEAAWGGVG